MEGTIDSLLLGFSVAFRPDVLWYAFVGCLVGTLVGVLPGIGPLAGIEHLAAGNIRARCHQGRDHAGGDLLRLAIRRLDHLDLDADTGRSLLSHDLYRWLRHGPEGSRRRSAQYRGGRLVDRRHVRRCGPDLDRAAARRICAALRPPRIYGPAGARSDLPGLHVVDRTAAHLVDGSRRPPARDGRYRQHDGPFSLRVRHPGTRRRHRHRAGRGRVVRPGRDPVDPERNRDRQGDRAETARAPPEPDGMASIGDADRARIGARVPGRADAGLRTHYFKLPLLRGGAAPLQASGGIRPRRCRWRRRAGVPPTMPPPPARSCRCWRSGCRPGR